MPFNKEHAMAVGAKFVELADAVSDGVDVTDVQKLMELGTAFMAAADEFKNDKDAAIFYALSGATGKVGDMKLDPPVDGQ